MIEAISVTKFNTYIKQIFDAEELLHNISIVGEVFDVKISRNVIYFYIKDDSSSLPCVCFYPNFIDLIKEGDKVIISGSPNFYIKGGRLNFNVVNVEKVGQGQLYEEFLRLKDTLQKEGLFDNAHKKAIPKNIKRVGVITSRDGAVIQDIQNIIWRRDPSIDIVLFNTKVQGNFAEKEIAKAIDLMSHYEKIDIIIVARGGGSLEDLSAYNTEMVARSTYNCEKPIISAVGHETDFTIIDFVSDLRAPTPSAAAELITSEIKDKKNALTLLKETFVKDCDNYIKQKQNEHKSNTIKLYNIIDTSLLKYKNTINEIKYKLFNVMDYYINQKYYDIGIIENTLNNLNPIEILQKGYAKIEQNNLNVKSSKDVDYDIDLNIVFKDGTIKARPLNDKN